MSPCRVAFLQSRFWRIVKISSSNNNFENEPVIFIIRFLFWLKRSNISPNATSEDIQYLDLCQHCLTTSDEMLFQFFYCPQKHGCFSSLSNLFVKFTALAYADLNLSSVFARFLLDMNYVLNLIKLKIHFSYFHLQASN